MKKLLVVLALVGAVTVSCNKKDDIIKIPQGAASVSIGVQVSDAADPATKSGTVSEQLFDSFVIDNIGEREIMMDAYVSDFNPLAFEDGPLTKGAIITTNYLKDSLKAFYLEAYAHSDWFENTKPDGEAGSQTNPHKAGYYFGTNTANVTYSDNKWSIFGEPKWINNVDLSFWSWWNASGAGPVIDAVAAGSTPDYSKAGFNYTNNGQSDLILAYNAEKREFDEKTGDITDGSGSSTGSNIMDIKFYHALAAVRFDVSGLKINGLTIKKITISGVYSKGHCSVTGTVGTNSSGTVSFSWPADSLSTTASFTQTFAAADFTETGLDGTTSKALMSMSSDKFLFFIPQEVKSKGMKIKIEYSVGSSSETTTSEVSLDHDTAWEAGKYYTYKLSAGAVDLALNGSLTGDSPEISVKNTGQVNTYIRVAIVGNWCLEDNTSTPSTWYPLSECPADDITFTKFNNSSNDSYGGHWTLNTSDGYWYYSLPVQPGWEVDLFEGFAAKSTAVHPAGTTLRLTVIGQAVKAGDATDWAGAATVSN